MMISGWSEEYVIEMLIAKYWVNNPQGIYAMANYFVIRTMKAIYYDHKGISNWYRLQELLTAYLPDGYEERYLECKERYFPQFKEKTSKEKVMNMDSYFYEDSKERSKYFCENMGYIVTVRDKLEKRILIHIMRI